MKLWIDDVRTAPMGYKWVHSVEEAKWVIEHYDRVAKIELIDIDHDAGAYVRFGGDYVRLLDWLEMTGRNFPIRIHSANAVGVDNMRRIIRHNGWKEVR